MSPEEVLHSVEVIDTGNLASTAADVLRQKSDGTWRIIIDNPWGTG